MKHQSKKQNSSRHLLMRKYEYMRNHIAALIYNHARKYQFTRRIAKAAGDFIYRDIRRNYPEVLGERESIDLIVKENVSVGRFGDGEFRVCRNKSCITQSASQDLTRRLNEVLHSEILGFYAAIPRLIADDPNMAANYKHIQIRNWRTTWSLRKEGLPRMSTFLSRLDMRVWSHSEYADYIRAVKSIWHNLDVVLVTNKETHRISLACDMLDNVKSLHFVQTPNESAYDNYAEILRNTKRFPAGHLFLLSCGSAATVLAYDLHKIGRRAVDIGNLILLYTGNCPRSLDLQFRNAE